MQAEVEFEIGVYCVPVFLPLGSECWGRAGGRIFGWFGLGFGSCGEVGFWFCGRCFLFFFFS